ncbi:histidine kinase [Chloroherpeton thalassium ATCC 35110]|uniref:histidine kinase n=1 Tax=Chloroherpeton thalassium (strain ATCC 35110 / GB-78) TaxID=517418 RepID=B3QU93_CHLT3|nr:two-component regulator propeller domain-containing protein [Chloroherpeton thalassium]ACF14342.1 histidine kinase [Chloroherpeton thalassium ATCC 35110]
MKQVFLFLILAFFAFAKPLLANDIRSLMVKIHRTWSEADGLPQNSINAIAADPNGWLWIGTQDGAAYYNGLAWQSIRMPNHTTSNIIGPKCLLATPDSVIWFGTEGGGLHALRPVVGLTPEDWQWQSYNTATGLCSDFLNCLYYGKNGEIYIGTDKGVSVLHNGMISDFPNKKNAIREPVFSIYQTKSGEIYFGTAKGIFVFQHEKLQRLDFPNDLSVRILSITEGADGQIFFCSEGEGIFVYAQKSVSHLAESDGLASNVVCSSFRSENGTLFFGTNNGISLFHNNRFETLTEQDGLTNKVVLSIYAAPNGKTYFGTEVGLSIYEQGSFLSLTQSEGLQDKVVWSIFQDSAEHLYFGTSAGISFFDGNRLRAIGENTPLGKLTVRTIFESQDGTIFFGTNEGVYALSHGNLHTFLPKSALSENTIFAILEHKNELFFGTRDNGVFIYDGKQLQRLCTENGLSSNYIYTLYKSPNGKIYIGTRGGGLAIYDGKTLFSLKKEDGLPNNDVRAIIQDSKGRFCFGTNSGLSIYDGKTFTNLSDTSRPALPNNVIYQVQEDQFGRLYALTNKGICRITEMRTPNTFGELPFKIAQFGKSDGLPSLEGNAGASFKDSRGRLWFGTIAGLAMFDPSQETPDTLQKPVLINKISIRKLPASELSKFLTNKNLQGELQLSYDQNDIHFDYACLSYKRESETRFQTQLIGYDDAPSDWKKSVRKEYTNLPAGSYIFTVRGMDYAGNISKPASVSFAILPAPWQTWWAYLLYVLASGGLIFGLIRWRIATLEEQKRALEKIVAERTAEVVRQKTALETSNEELRKLSNLKTEFLSIAAHDLKNPLQSILGFAQLVKENAKNAEMVAQMGDAIYQSSKRMFLLIKDLLETSKIESGKLELNQSPVDLASLASIVADSLQFQAYQKEQTIQVQMEKSCDVLADGDRISEVLENLISNAVKYSPNKTTITIVVRKTRSENGDGQELVQLAVKDEGLGLSAEDKQKIFGRFQKLSARPTGGESSTGLGLSIVKTLVEAHGGRVWAESDGKNKGTTFFVELPAYKPAG